MFHTLGFKQVYIAIINLSVLAAKSFTSTGFNPAGLAVKVVKIGWKLVTYRQHVKDSWKDSLRTICSEPTKTTLVTKNAQSSLQ